MWTPSTRVAGGVTALGGVCVALAALPTDWFGPRPTDSYVFDPPRFSALWVERTVIPVVAIAAALLLLVGLLALFYRDRARLPRWQRWFAVVAVVGTAVGALATMLVLTAGGRPTADPTAALNVLLGVALGLLGALLALPGLVAWGAGYLQSGHRRLGTALVGGPAGTALVLAVNVAAGVSFGAVGGLVFALPTAVAALLVGHDLWTRAPAG